MGAQRIRDNLIFGSHGILLVKSLTTVYKKYGQIARGPTYISDYIFPSILREAETVFARHDCTPSLFATQNQV